MSDYGDYRDEDQAAHVADSHELRETEDERRENEFIVWQAAYMADELRRDDDGQSATAFFIAGQLAAQVEHSLTGTKPFDVVLFPDGYPATHPAFMIEFRESGLRYRVSVEPNGKRESEARGE